MTLHVKPICLTKNKNLDAQEVVEVSKNLFFIMILLPVFDNFVNEKRHKHSTTEERKW